MKTITLVDEVRIGEDARLWMCFLTRCRLLLLLFFSVNRTRPCSGS